MGGVDRPTSGKVYINGTDIFSLNDDKLAIFRRQKIGLPISDNNLILPCVIYGRWQKQIYTLYKIQ